MWAELGALVRARLGILSDTHLPKPGGLPDILLRAFEGVDAILHGGDVTDLSCLRPLVAIAPLYLVTGNNDPPEMAMQYGWRRALRWRGWRIGLVHGDEGSGRTTPHRARNAFRDAPPSYEEVSVRAPQTAALPPLPETRVAVPAGRPTQMRLRAPSSSVFDWIVCGHSHTPYCQVLDGVLVLNPGSPTERRREPRASFVVVETDDLGLDVRFFYF